MTGKPGTFRIHEIQRVRLRFWYGLDTFPGFLVVEDKLQKIEQTETQGEKAAD